MGRYISISAPFIQPLMQGKGPAGKDDGECQDIVDFQVTEIDDGHHDHGDREHDDEPGFFRS